MYYDGLYTANWILGYKTARLVFSLPLCIFSAISNINKYGKLKLTSYLAIIISCISCVKTESTGATTAILLLGILFIIISISYKRKVLYNFIQGIFNFKVIIPVYAIIVVAVILIDQVPVIQYIVVNWLGKDATLTTRTYIWALCIEKIIESPIWGYGYITNANFVKITGNGFAGTAHNMILSILVSAGIIGLIIYIAIIISTMRKVNLREDAAIELILCAGIIIQLFIGISSSSLIFCSFSFVFYDLISIYRSNI
ncbi:O-antigen ligase family protein [Clostridium sp. SM-530-WT-3G]|uniref:O-antigen ligase family protein n=1 Tax=Clostridium sp. SM-530-WT-3G TaxID=2725303 RepID=UPI00145E7973|nr:O-antigen ligase family protein [Clostridium sp. SM-530-WT-3G]NME83746.1 hypothetical protein [Clostridium sp. SM-530-WT-3G]